MKKLIALVLLSSLAGSGPAGGAEVPSSTVADYAAAFENADLGCCIIRDSFHRPPQPMSKGKAGVGETAVWDARDRSLQMKLKAPGTIEKDAAGNMRTPSMGIFGTGYCLGPGRPFTVEATFRKPVRAVSTDSWNVAVVARTGGVSDSPDLGRLQLSLRVNNGQANLRVQEGLDNATTGAIPGAKTDVTGDAFEEIYTLAEPFKLSLHVNRQTGSGTARLTTKTQNISIDFTTRVFTQDPSSPMLNVVGATLANTGPKLTASVEVTNFELSAPLCPPVSSPRSIARQTLLFSGR